MINFVMAAAILAVGTVVACHTVTRISIGSPAENIMGMCVAIAFAVIVLMMAWKEDER